MMNPGDYVLADLVGFYNSAGQPVSTLRCKVLRVLDKDTVELITADLSDAGTIVPRPVRYCRPLMDESSAGLVHRDGLVVLDG